MNSASAFFAALTASLALERAPLKQERPPHLSQPAPPQSSSHGSEALVVPSHTMKERRQMFKIKFCDQVQNDGL